MANQVSAKSIKSYGFVYVAVCVLRSDTGEWVASGVAALRKCLQWSFIPSGRMPSRACKADRPNSTSTSLPSPIVENFPNCTHIGHASAPLCLAAPLTPPRAYTPLLVPFPPLCCTPSPATPRPISRERTTLDDYDQAVAVLEKPR